jgi:outer membrane protein OmpA-like peptidoglycan-associated protein
MRRACLAAVVVTACAHPRPPVTPPLRLDRVVLFGNGLGHFERRGAVDDGRLRLVLRPHEVDDVIKTLTVVDRDGVAQQVAAVLPKPDAGDGERVVVEVALSRPARELVVSYAVPTAAWKTTYRLVLPRQAGAPVGFQAWAMIDNLSEEPWTDVHLALATGAPLSFATDLRTPHFVPRPDATGALVAPTTTAVVTSTDSRGGAGDRDRDGVRDDVDLCPQAAEDADDHDDGDGCPDRDDDGDRVPDVDDRCPREAETYNGIDDDDGCPDRGRVILTSSAVQILDQLYFRADDATLAPTSGPLLDAVAATLRGNPDLTRVEVAGHAAADEGDPWALSARRAAAVRTALRDRGVGQELTIVPFGASQPLGGPPARDRRVGFEVQRGAPRSGEPLAPPSGPPPARGQAIEVAGTARWALRERVSVPRGASTLVSVLAEELTGDAVLLYRPEPGAPGSHRHPFRAARLELPAALTLEPGPVAVFADGSFAGEALLARTAGGRTSYLPYALDGGTTVEVAVSGADRPQRLVAIVRGVATVTDARVVTTRYTVTAGAGAPARIFLEHPRAPGHDLGPLPPGSEPDTARVLVALPLTPGQTSTVAIEERRPVTRELRLLDDAGALAAYLDGDHLPAPVVAAASAVADARAALGQVEGALADAQAALADASDRADELERSLATVAKLPGPDAAALRARLLTHLTEATAARDRAARAIASQRAAAVEARIKLEATIAALALTPLAP